MGIQRILSRVSEAYGRMMLYEGLFQADGHPGNILVMKGDSHECMWCQVTRIPITVLSHSEAESRSQTGWHQNPVRTSCN